MLPNLSAQQPIEIRRHVRVDNKLIRRRHRFQNPFARINAVLESQIVIVHRATPAANPRREPVPAACTPVDKPANWIA
jgi:hypothetical protein